MVWDFRQCHFLQIEPKGPFAPKPEPCGWDWSDRAGVWKRLVDLYPGGYPYRGRWAVRRVGHRTAAPECHTYGE